MTVVVTNWTPLTPSGNKAPRLPDPRITDPAGPAIAKDNFVRHAPIEAKAAAGGPIGRRDFFQNAAKWTAGTVAGLVAGTVGFFAPIAALEFTIGPVAAAPYLGFLVPLCAMTGLAGAGYWAFHAVEKKMRGY